MWYKYAKTFHYEVQLTPREWERNMGIHTPMKHGELFARSKEEAKEILHNKFKDQGDIVDYITIQQTSWDDTDSCLTMQ